MTAYVFENADPTGVRFIHGFRDEPLRLAFVFGGPDGGTDEEICEALFGILNRDDRPNGKVASSLSVGDVVTIEDDEAGGARSYACEGQGWRKLDRIYRPLESARQRLDADMHKAERTGEIVRTPVEGSEAWSV